MKINFYNHDSKKNLTLDTEKSLIMVYGKNGNGKTTLSRSPDLDAKYVFNEDFIYSNVYNVSENGAGQTSKTKENFSGLWIGEEIVKVRKEISDIIIERKRLEEMLNGKMSKIITYFQNNGIPFNYQNKLKNLIDENFKYEIGKFDELIKKYKSKYIFETDIKDDSDFKNKVKFVKENSVHTMLLSEIKKNDFISDLILKTNNNKITELNNIILDLNNHSELILKVEEIYSEKNINPIMSNKIEEWYKLHLNRTSCMFCGNNNITEAMSEWKTVLEDSYSKEKKIVINSITETINICKSIIENETFKNVDLELVQFLEYVECYLESKVDEINNNKFNEIVFNKSIDKREIIEINSAIEKLINYSLNRNLDEISFIYNALNYLDRDKINKMELSDKLMKENGNQIADSINNKFRQFGLDKSIKIDIDKRSIPHKFIYSLKNHNGINELSDGQKHKLALAIFMNYLENQDLENKIIVIDDPVVSLDICGYILFKQYLIKELIENHFKKSTTLIILTHDISYLYIQLSNIFENEKMRNITSIYKLSSSEIKEIHIDFIKTDDITLFRNLLDNLNNLSELKIINSIFIKIFRIMIDLRLRFTGQSFADNINIDKLPCDATKIYKLKKINRLLCEVGRKPNPSYDEIYLAISKLYDSSLILGFEGFILEKHVKKVKQIIEENIDSEEVGDLFEIIQSLKKFLESASDDEMKNYINHTRNSYSRNIIGLGLEDFYEEKEEN